MRRSSSPVSLFHILWCLVAPIAVAPIQASELLDGPVVEPPPAVAPLPAPPAAPRGTVPVEPAPEKVAPDEPVPGEAPQQRYGAPEGGLNPVAPPPGFGQKEPEGGAGDRNPPGDQPRDRRRPPVEIRMRVMWTDLGIDTASQDAIVAYIAEDEKAKGKVRDASRRLMNAIVRNLPPERMRELVAVYRAALDADKERRHAAQTALDAKIGFSLNPRLEGLLWIFGVLGDGQIAVNPYIPRGGPTPNREPQGNRENGAGGGPIMGGMGVPGGRPNRDFGGLNGGPWRNDRNGPGNRTDTPPQAGTVYGSVTAKEAGWIEVKSAGGTAERYMPFWNATGEGAGGYDRAVLEAIAVAKVGDLVRLEWVWSDRKRVVKLEPWVPAVPTTEPAPKTAAGDQPVEETAGDPAAP